MIYLAQPAYLFLLLLIPLFFVGYALWLRRCKRLLARLGDPGLIEKLIPDASTGKGWLKITLLALAWLFFVIGLARPQTGARLKEHESKGAEVMIALDVSNSMLAEDYSPNRLERSKLAISRLVDKLAGDRVGLVVFAGQAFVQLPITTDYVSAKIFLSSTNTNSVPVQGTALAEAISTCARSYSTQSEKSRAIIVISDGENHEDDPVEAASQAAGMGIKVYTIGVGSLRGEPISVNGELLKDREGNIVVTHLDEETLKNVARAGKGAYIHAGNEEFGLNPIINDLRKLEEEAYKSVVFEEYEEEYMYFFAIALVLFVIEMLIGSRRWKRRLFE